MLGGTLAAVLGIGMLPADVHAEGADGQTGLPAPVLYASFDNADAEDSSGNGNNGTVIGTPEFVDGVSGKAVSPAALPATSIGWTSTAPGSPRTAGTATRSPATS